MRLYPAPAVSVGKLGSLADISPANPKIISFALLVETAVTEGADAVVCVAVLGSTPFGSHGETVFAPLTPKATIEVSSVEPESVTVIVVDESWDGLYAHQTSSSEYGEVPIEADDLWVKVNPVAVTLLTVLTLE
jgi:hypothetical protein